MSNILVASPVPWSPGKKITDLGACGMCLTSGEDHDPGRFASFWMFLVDSLMNLKIT